jgi:hypothetical protein
MVSGTDPAPDFLSETCGITADNPFNSILKDALSNHRDHGEEICALGHYARSWIDEGILEGILQYFATKWASPGAKGSEQGECVLDPNTHSSKLREQVEYAMTHFENHKKELCELSHNPTFPDAAILEAILGYLQYQWGLEAEYEWMILSQICPRPLGPVEILAKFESVVSISGDDGVDYPKPMTPSEKNSICQLLKKVSMNPSTREDVESKLFSIDEEINGKMAAVDQALVQEERSSTYSSLSSATTWKKFCYPEAKWQQKAEDFMARYDWLLIREDRLSDDEKRSVCAAFGGLDNFFEGGGFDSDKIVRLLKQSTEKREDGTLYAALTDSQVKRDLYETYDTEPAPEVWVSSLMGNLIQKMRLRSGKILRRVDGHHSTQSSISPHSNSP